MGYVKISDPNIIDLNAIHNIINIVNQHSDTLNGLTNNVGAIPAGSTTYNTEDSQHLFDTSNQKVIYGRTVFDSSSTHINSTSPSGKVYSVDVNYTQGSNSLSQFSTGNPMVFLTIHTGNTSSGVSSTFADARVNVFNVTSSSFKIRLFMAETIGSGQKIYVNWMVIGPK